ncbi:hypothetical protein K1719_011357 [Acacia pycnantha]|nr:hypothetical protein K1719_011357 [Acacia pycnantha]
MDSKSKASSSRDGSSSSSQLKPRSCLCSPTTHPGSFRCSFHKNQRPTAATAVARISRHNLHHHHNPMRTMKAVLQEMIKPSSHDIHRRKNFRARPSRFFLMNSSATDAAALAVY